MLDTALPSAEFLLGLPYLGGALSSRAEKIGASVLVSANAFSIWRREGEPFNWPDKTGRMKPTRCRDWVRFRHPSRSWFDTVPIHLDSAGYVALSEYKGFPWTVDQYLDLCAAAPWKWFASMDMCVEPQIARHETAILDRISGTVRLNLECLNGAERRGISDRFVPVIQGWSGQHYLRCLDRMAWIIEGRPLVGIGSMCRRNVEGQYGILQIVDALDRAMPRDVRFHLFGIKSDGMEELRGHPRIASFDSQAYGTAARRDALRTGRSKTNAFLADVMEDWHRKQTGRLAKRGYAIRRQTGMLDLRPGRSCDPIEDAIARSEEELRQLHEEGEIAWNGVNARWAYEGAFLDD